jgi:hypothetical protein
MDILLAVHSDVGWKPVHATLGLARSKSYLRRVLDHPKACARRSDDTSD